IEAAKVLAGGNGQSASVGAEGRGVPYARARRARICEIDIGLKSATCHVNSAQFAAHRGVVAARRDTQVGAVADDERGGPGKAAAAHVERMPPYLRARGSV